MLDELATQFADRYGIDVAVQQVSPARLPELVSTAVLSGTLPDVILHPVEFTAGWAEGGVLDPDAADEVVNRLGRDTFDPAALELVDAGGVAAALPSDGYHQLLVYRADWFEERGLASPDTYAAMATAAERLFDREAIISGLVVPTESNLVTTHQAFEHIALANGCRLIDEAGEVTILEPGCRAALEHYFTTINRYSPSGVQTDTSARNALLDGLTGMIITSPAILPDLAGLNPAAMPGCPECVASEDGVNELARRVGVLTELRGPNGEPAAFGNARALGITTAADLAAAQAFAEFWFTEAYESWLAVNPERKVPLRLGTADEPRRFIDSWGTTPLAGSDLSLRDIYGEEVVARLRDGVAAAPRWGLREGYGGLMSQLYDEFIISIVLQEMLSGYFGIDTTLQEAYRRTVELIPNYAFPIAVEEETGP
jgi:multiple sugar transport system substrate-binding protein